MKQKKVLGIFFYSIIMAKIENLDFLEEILKNQIKVRKHTPQKLAILLNFSIIEAPLD